jgi:hypothetical protein
VLPHLRLDDLLAELQARMQAVMEARDQMRGLLAAVVAIGSGLDLESTLRRIVRTAVGLVDATYGALGLIGDGKPLAKFIPVGLTSEEIGQIQHWPEGRGLLRLLIDDPRPRRLADISAHPEPSGFPEGHPPMRSFLGVPVRVRDVVFGNLYLTGKRGGDAERLSLYEDRDPDRPGPARPGHPAAVRDRHVAGGNGADGDPPGGRQPDWQCRGRDGRDDQGHPRHHLRAADPRPWPRNGGPARPGS